MIRLPPFAGIVTEADARKEGLAVQDATAIRCRRRISRTGGPSSRGSQNT